MTTSDTLNRFCLLTFLLLCTVFAQAQSAITPPSLTNGQGAVYAVNRLKAGAYRYKTGGVRMTARFRLTETGELDTVGVVADDDTALPVAYLADIGQSIRSLNGQWTPQRRNGVAEKSYWLVAHYYLVREGGLSPAIEATSAAYQARYNQERAVFEQKRPGQRSVQTDGCVLDGETWLFAPYRLSWISCSMVTQPR
ncbi:hypothetical protein ACAW74_13775 [Fibrella sp. WM1]|uniref:hypothetical protein n=1 Tax=Fibrella musci TaxID=3242485 RepID=UPI0035205BE7